MRTAIAGLLCLPLAVLLGCSLSEDTARAEREILRFHEMLSGGLFEELYDGSSRELKQATSKDDFVALLDAVNRKLGQVRSASKLSRNVNYHTSGTFVTLMYETVFAEGEGTETFIYRLNGDEALLAGYRINSTDLILK